MKINFNEEKNGIEISFDIKPEKSILELLKGNGFRWSNSRRLWYAKQTESTLNFIKTFNAENIVESVTNNTNTQSNKKIIDLWQLTRTNNIKPNHDFISTYPDGWHEAIYKSRFKARAENNNNSYK